MNACPFHYRKYRCTDPVIIDRFIDIFPLAMITSHRHGAFSCSHIPLLRRPDGSLYGHVDGLNPQFSDEPDIYAQIVFMGPSGYVPPQAYVSTQLPTWNYLAVHMEANVTMLNAVEDNLEILQTTARALAGAESDFQVDEHDPRVVANLPHIRGLVVNPINVEGRFKLSQDKSAEDSSAALEWLLSHRSHDHARFLKELLIDTTRQAPK